MRSRVLALLMALVVGLFAGWPAVAASSQAPAGPWALALAQGLEAPQPAALSTIDVVDQVDASAATTMASNAAVTAHTAAEPPADSAPDHPAPDHWAEFGASAPLVAEGAPDLPALFLLGLGAHASSATMARPRPHAAASWQRLYLNVPLRPPRTPLAA